MEHLLPLEWPFLSIRLHLEQVQMSTLAMGQSRALPAFQVTWALSEGTTPSLHLDMDFDFI